MSGTHGLHDLLACFLIAAGKPVVQVPQPHHVVMVQYAGHVAPVPTAAALLPERLACTQQ